MRRRLLFVIVVLITLVVLVISGCMKTQGIVHMETMGEIPIPPKGKAVIVFVRPADFAKTLATRIYDGETLVGVLRGKTYFAYETTPGKHLFSSAGHEAVKYTNFTFVNANLLAGKTYYIDVHFYETVVGMGFQYWAELEPIRPGDKKQGDMKTWLKELKECARIELDHEAMKTEQDIASNVSKYRERFYKDGLKKGKFPELRSSDGV